MIGGVVLAAGASSRFGTPKQLALLGGMPLLQHAIDAQLGVPAIERIVVVLGAHAVAVAAGIDLAEAEALVCDEWTEGMAASLRAGVQALGLCDWVIVTLGDQPLITSQVVAAVVDHTARARAGEAAVRATYAGQPGHPVALRRAVLADVAQLRGDIGARELLARRAVRGVEVGRLCRPDDVDTPEDLDMIAR